MYSAKTLKCGQFSPKFSQNRSLFAHKIFWRISISFWHLQIIFNSRTMRKIKLLWPSNAIWWHKLRSTLAQVMACCLIATSHYLNQCSLIINGILWYSPKNNFTGVFFKLILPVDIMTTSCEISLRWVPQNLIKWSVLVQVMTCHLFGTIWTNVDLLWIKEKCI